MNVSIKNFDVKILAEVWRKALGTRRARHYQALT